MSVATITYKDFQPWNSWTDRVAVEGDEPSFSIDDSTGRRYWLQSTGTLRAKCALLLLWSVAAHTIKTVKRIFSFITLYQFHYHYHFHRNITLYQFHYHYHFHRYHCPNGRYSHYSLKERITEASKDFLKILATPLLVVALEGAALYGIVNPYDGRKLYASVERFFYLYGGMEGVDIFGRPAPGQCAPCFQPEATRHALGGDVNNPNAW